MGSKRHPKIIRVGVIGLRRGLIFAAQAKFCGMQLVALCDCRQDRLRPALKKFPGVVPYVDYDRFLEHEMDAVILANFFHQHAPLAVKALRAGFHVLSETSACKTPAEGVALARAVERSEKIYMFAENYCFFATNQEMRRLYHAGKIGEVQLAECEYIHPFRRRDVDELAPGVNHWRNWIPATYFCRGDPLGPAARSECVSRTGYDHGRNPGLTQLPGARRAHAGSRFPPGIDPQTI